MAYNATDVVLAQIPGYRQSKTTSTSPPVQKPQVTSTAAPDPAGFAAKMNSFKADANAAQQSLSIRYTDGYYDAYHGDAADYATHFKDTKSKLGAKANSLLGDIEKLRGIYGSDWADDALRSINSAMAKVNGYSDKVKNDADFWNQFENEADYGAAMFNSSAETGDEFRQMVEAKHANLVPSKYSAFADPGLLEAQKAMANQSQQTAPAQQPGKPASMDPTAYAIAMNAKSNQAQTPNTPTAQTPDEQLKRAQAMMAKRLQYPQGYAISMQAKNQQAANAARQNPTPVPTSQTPAATAETSNGKHQTKTYYLPEAAKALGQDAVAFIKDVTALQNENDRLKDSRSNMSVNIYDKGQLDAYGKISDQIEANNKQLKQIIENNADAYVKLTINRMMELAKKGTLTPDERNEVVLYISALRKSAGNLSGFGNTYNKDNKILSNSYKALADILANKSNEPRAFFTGAAATIPGYTDGVAMLNSPGMQAVNNGVMTPAISSIVNNNNAIADVMNNNPMYFDAGIVSGLAGQAALNSAAVKVMDAASQSLAAESLVDDAPYFVKHLDTPHSSVYTEGAGETVIDSVPKMRVGQWMSKTEYEQFLKTGEIPRTNVLTKGMDGYIKQANKGDFYVEFDIDPSLLAPKNEALGWSLIKPKNQMYIKLYQNKGLSWPEAIGYNISHVYTK